MIVILVPCTGTREPRGGEESPPAGRETLRSTQGDTDGET